MKNHLFHFPRMTFIFLPFPCTYVRYHISLQEITVRTMNENVRIKLRQIISFLPNFLFWPFSLIPCHTAQGSTLTTLKKIIVKLLGGNDIFLYICNRIYMEEDTE